MSQFVNTPTKTFRTAGAISIHQRCLLGSGGTVTMAGLADRDIGVAESTVASGDLVSVRLISATGTHKAIASEAISAGSLVYTESDGEVQDTAQATSYLRGIALEAATADQDVIEILPLVGGITAVT